MKTRRIAAVVLATFLHGTVGGAAFAQGAPNDDPVTVQARVRFKEGVDFYDKGRFEEARLAFLQAYALKKHPAVLLNLAQSSARSSHLLDASKYFQQYLREAVTATPAQRSDAEKGLEEVRQKIGRIEVVGPPAGTDVTLDDNKVGVAPLTEPLDVEPGAHTVRAGAEAVKITAPGGQKVQARFGAPAPLAAATTAPTTTTTSEPPPASSSTPLPNSSRHTNLLTPPETMVPFYIGLTAGVAGAATAIIFGIFRSNAQSKSNSVDRDIRSAAAARSLPAKSICSTPSVSTDFAPACSTLRDDNDKVDADATIANVALIVMGAGLVTAAGWYLLAPKRGETTGFTVSPYAGAGGGGLDISGRF